MQALRNASSALLPGVRRMASAASGAETQAAYWAKFFPQPVQTAEGAKKAVNKEMIGFLLLGPVGVGFMLYDYAVGLEEENHHIVPPYPWMRMRRNPGMPWGEDGLFEPHPRVAKVWPPAEGAAPSHH